MPVLLYPLFHPAAALRTPAVLQQLRGDFARIPALLEQERAPTGPPALAAAAPVAAPAEPPQLELLG